MDNEEVFVQDIDSQDIALPDHQIKSLQTWQIESCSKAKPQKFVNEVMQAMYSIDPKEVQEIISYLLSSWNGISLGQGVSYPKPSLQVIPSNVIEKGENFTIRCQGPLEGVRFLLFRDRNVVQSQDPPGNVAEFHFTSARQQDSGTYICRYNPTSDGGVYSDTSDPIIIQVRDTFPKPSLQVSPGNVTTRGGTLTFTCKGERPNMRFTLRWRGEDQRIEEPPGMQAVFTVSDVQYEGTYDCYYQTKSIPIVFSEPSESRHIRVLDIQFVTDSAGIVPVPGTESVEGGAKPGVDVCTEPDFSQRIIVQSVMVVVVLLVLLVILAEHFYSMKKKNA